MEKKHSFALSSIIRQNRNNSDGEAPVYLRITCNGERAEVSIKVCVHPAKWHPGKGRIKGNGEETRRLNNCIETFEHRAREVYNRQILAGKMPTARYIKNEIIGNEADRHFLLKSFKDFVAEITSRSGKDYAPGTIKNWKVTEGHLEQFIKATYDVTDIAFKDLELSFLYKLDLYASTQWGCGKNATLKHIERIRKIVNKAVSLNWLEKDPFQAFQGKQEKTHRTFLTEEELRKIAAKEITIER